MEHLREQKVEPKGKVLVLRRPQSGVGTNDHSNGGAAADAEQRMQSLDRWSVRMWWAIAWAVSACRVDLAIVRHEVFSADATLAFLVAAVMPVMRARQLAGLLAAAVRAVRRAISARLRSECDPQAPASQSGPAMSKGAARGTSSV